MAQLLDNLKITFVDSNGDPLAGGLVYSYAAGTSTPLVTYTDYGEGTANDNPTVLDANGQASIWLGSAGYKFVVKDADENTLYTVDNVFDIANGSVITSKLADDAVTTAKIADLNVTTAKINNLAVTNGKIADDAVNGDKIADNSITNAHMTDDSVDTAEIVDGAITQAKRASLGQQLSSASGSYSTSSSSFVDVTNLSVSITTTGRPVYLGLVWSGTGSGYIGARDTSGTVGSNANIQILRDATAISYGVVGGSLNVTSSGSDEFRVPLGSIWHIDTPSAGTYTYKVQIAMTGTSVTGYVLNAKLIAYEL